MNFYLETLIVTLILNVSLFKWKSCKMSKMYIGCASFIKQGTS